MVFVTWVTDTRYPARTLRMQPLSTPGRMLTARS